MENHNRIYVSRRKLSASVFFVQFSGYSKENRFRVQLTLSSRLKIGSEKCTFYLKTVILIDSMSNNIGYLQIRNIDCGPSVCMVLLESRRRIFKAE